MKAKVLYLSMVLVLLSSLGIAAMLTTVSAQGEAQSANLIESQNVANMLSSGDPYACEEDLIEVMFAQDSEVRLRHGALVDLATNALSGVDGVLQKLAWFEWYRICDVPEERLDEIQACGEANTGEPVYNLNNIYRLRIPMGLDVWAISEELEALPGIMLARPVPKPTHPPPTTIQLRHYQRCHPSR